jgi:hypothetical protein
VPDVWKHAVFAIANVLRMCAGARAVCRILLVPKICNVFQLSAVSQHVSHRALAIFQHSVCDSHNFPLCFELEACVIRSVLLDFHSEHFSVSL